MTLCALPVARRRAALRPAQHEQHSRREAHRGRAGRPRAVAVLRAYMWPRCRRARRAVGMLCTCCRQLGVASRRKDSTVHFAHLCTASRAMGRRCCSDSTAPPPPCSESSTWGARRSRRRASSAQHVDRRHRLGTAASAPPPPRAPVLLLPLRLLPLRLPVWPWEEVRPWKSPGGCGAARAGPKLAPSGPCCAPGRGGKGWGG